MEGLPELQKEQAAARQKVQEERADGNAAHAAAAQQTQLLSPQQVQVALPERRPSEPLSSPPWMPTSSRGLPALCPDALAGQPEIAAHGRDVARRRSGW